MVKTFTSLKDMKFKITVGLPSSTRIYGKILNLSGSSMMEGFN